MVVFCFVGWGVLVSSFSVSCGRGEDGDSMGGRIVFGLEG